MDVLDGQNRAVLESIAAIIPTRNMAAAVAFYERLGFVSEPYEDGSSYVFMSRDESSFHLTLMRSPEWRFNPMGVYFYMSDIDVFYDEVIAAGVKTLGAPEDKPWRMREFAVSDPDETLLRFGERIHPR